MRVHAQLSQIYLFLLGESCVRSKLFELTALEEDNDST